MAREATKEVAECAADVAVSPSVDITAALVGGDEGSALRQLADATFAEQRIVNPARIAALLAPWPER